MSSFLSWPELGGIQLHGCSHGVLLPGSRGLVGVLVWAAPKGPWPAHFLIGWRSAVLRWGRRDVLPEGPFVLGGWQGWVALRVPEVCDPQIREAGVAPLGRVLRTSPWVIGQLPVPVEPSRCRCQTVSRISWCSPGKKNRHISAGDPFLSLPGSVLWQRPGLA